MGIDLAESEEIILGIDLGTTNSACAIWRDGEAQVIPNSHGDKLTPSAVSIDDDGSILVGKAAKQRLVTHPANSVACFKRYIGTNHQIDLGKRHRYTATELSAFVLQSLKSDAEHELGCEITKAVISVPAYFNETQRQATRDAGEIAGLTVNRLVNEPTAAAMAHGLHKTDEHRFMVLDLGGGTFDVSILEYFEGVLEVHSTSGDSALGGEDFNDALVRALLERHELTEAELSDDLKQQIYVKVETAKRKLGPNNPVELEVEANGQKLSWTIDEQEFTEATARLLMRLRSPMERAMRDAGIRPQDLDDVVLVGGATRMFVFRGMVSKLFGRLPRTDIDPDMTIVEGAAIQAGLLARDESLEDVVLTDVCPFSLGIASMTESPSKGLIQVFFPIIDRNSIVPVSRFERFVTVDKNQKSIAVQIFQGESRRVQNNLFLGDLDIPVPRNKAGAEAIDVRFSYDANGLLEVDVTVVSTGKAYKKVLENRPGQLSESEKKKSLKRLAGLKVLPRDLENVRAVSARADRLYESLLGPERDMLGRHMDEFQAVLDRQDPMEIERSCKQFNEFLDELDKDIWQ